MVEFLRAIVRARLNILVCGGTGSGKTTMLNCLSAFVPEDERIVTIEDSAELSLQQPHVVRLETRPPNLEGKGEVTQRDLVKNCLRMRPDRIVVGEVRGAEVFDMLQAMSTGHDGSIATIHANSPRECLGRLEMMMLLSGVSDSAARDAPADRLRRQHHRPRQPPLRRLAQGDEDFRDQRNGRRDDHDAGPVRIRAHRHRADGKISAAFARPEFVPPTPSGSRSPATRLDAKVIRSGYAMKHYGSSDRRRQCSRSSSWSCWLLYCSRGSGARHAVARSGPWRLTGRGDEVESSPSAISGRRTGQEFLGSALPG